MRILVICQHYYPEPFRITDICENLVNLGHDVTVVTGTPNYPMGYVYSGYEDGKRVDEVVNGVKVHRCKIHPRKTGIINRVRNYLSYAVKSTRYVKSIKEDFDVVFINQLSPVIMANAGLKYAKKHNKKCILYCLDLWPESLCVGGIKRGSIIYNIFKVISKKIYSSADEILVSSQDFKDYLQGELNLKTKDISYLPQYAEDLFLQVESCKQGDLFNLLFAGNIGKAQSVETIVQAAKRLENEKVVFHIVGDGSQFENIKSMAKSSKNVILYGRKFQEEMLDFYNMADAMLITLIDDEVISKTIPGKVQSYMAAGKPIVGAINGETARVLECSQGGYVGPANDDGKLAENILALCKSGKCQEIGMSNRRYYLQYFSKEKFFERLIKSFGESIN